MKLAAALSERADIQRRLSELNERLQINARVQEGEKPAEDPLELLAELDGCLARYEFLVARINLTNTAVECDGASLTELLAHRDVLGRRLGILRSFLDSASRLTDRYSLAEIKVSSSVDVAALRKDVDAASKELRLLDEKIQEINWTTELL